MARGNDDPAGTRNAGRAAFPVLVPPSPRSSMVRMRPALDATAVAPVSTQPPHGHQTACTAARLSELAVASRGRERVQPATVPVTLGRPPPSPIRGMTGLIRRPTCAWAGTWPRLG